MTGRGVGSPRYRTWGFGLDVQDTSARAIELEERYARERDKRLTEGVRTYKSLRDLNVDRPRNLAKTVTVE